MATPDTSLKPDFTALPTLSLAQARDPATKPAFLAQLRHALLAVGFLYLADTGIPDELFDRVAQQCHAFFEELPEAEKLAIEMKNERSFLGYSRGVLKLDNEITAGKPDHREQLDLATPHALPAPSAPPWHHLYGPNQWPSAQHLPAFRATYEEYMVLLGALSMEFTRLVAEALGLPSTALDHFFDADQLHKLKLVRYPEARPGSGASGQGVGAHKDSMLSSFLLQASSQRGLQAQNLRGEWIDCAPVRGTLVVAMGQGLQAITGGACAATTHRVRSPQPGEGARYSVPFFQGVSFDAEFESVEVPEQVWAEKRAMDAKAGRKGADDVEFTFVKGRWRNLGEATLMNRVKSHPDVSERWYPDLLAKIRQQQAQNASSAAAPADGAAPTATRSTVSAH